jgi:hypothetical protein
MVIQYQEQQMRLDFALEKLETKDSNGDTD